MSSSDTDTHHRTPKSARQVFAWLMALGAVVLTVVACLLPAISRPNGRPPTPAWKNLHQISLHLCFTEAEFPHDPKGPEYALYALSGELPASCFDTYPHRRPEAQARWDHVDKRLRNADFEYINRPNVARSSGPMIVLAEKPHRSYRSIMLLSADGRITHCKTPTGSSRELFDTWQSWDDFLVKGQALFREWQSVPLPSISGHSTATSEAAEGSIWGTRTVHRAYGGEINVYYAYQRGELVRRIFASPKGSITDSVTTDDLGRIVAFQRQPDDWQSFWPVKRKSDQEQPGENGGSGQSNSP